MTGAPVRHRNKTGRPTAAGPEGGQTGGLDFAVVGVGANAKKARGWQCWSLTWLNSLLSVGCLRPGEGAGTSGRQLTAAHCDGPKPMELPGQLDNPWPAGAANVTYSPYEMVVCTVGSTRAEGEAVVESAAWAPP